MDPGIVPGWSANWAWGLPLVEHSGRERRSANYPAAQRDYEEISHKWQRLSLIYVLCYAWNQMYRSASVRPQATNNSINHCKGPFSAAGTVDSFCDVPGIQICPHRRLST
jgi:hypothetical protein